MDNFSFVDWIIKNWDKEPILEYISLTEDNKLWNKINNFTYRFNWNLIDWDEISVNIHNDAIPDYSWFDLQVYKQNDTELVLSYEFWQWCRNNCFYCYNLNKWWNYIIKDINKIVCDLKQLKDYYNTNLFNLDDDEINYSNEFLVNISDEIVKNNLNIYWTALIIPRDLEKELLQKMYNAWCRQLRFWIESWSKKILDIIWKNTSSQWIEKILSFCKEIWISTYATFIVDLPQETNLDIKQTLEFIYKNKSLLDFVNICAYNAHLWTFDQRYFKYILWLWDYDFDRTKRFSKKKLLLRAFCDKLSIYDIDVIQFMKHKLWEK